MELSTRRETPGTRPIDIYDVGIVSVEARGSWLGVCTRENYIQRTVSYRSDNAL